MKLKIKIALWYPGSRRPSIAEAHTVDSHTFGRLADKLVRSSDNCAVGQESISNSLSHLKNLDLQAVAEFLEST
jgi:hypothetical protein